LVDQNSEIFEPRCKELQYHNGVRFAAIIDQSGNKIAGGFTEGVSPYEGDEKNLHDFYKFAVDISLRTDHLSNSLGNLNYIASRRDKVILISFPFPISSNILLISAEPGLDIENLALDVVKIFSSESLAED
jgi:hypothetical protein